MKLIYEIIYDVFANVLMTVFIFSSICYIVNYPTTPHAEKIILMFALMPSFSLLHEKIKYRREITKLKKELADLRSQQTK